MTIPTALPTRFLAALALAVACASPLLAQTAPAPAQSPVPQFVSGPLGGARPGGLVTRRPARDVRVAVRGSRFEVEQGSLGVSLAALETGDGEWTAYERGASRDTPYGAQTVTMLPGKVEEFLTVSQRQGDRPPGG